MFIFHKLCSALEGNGIVVLWTMYDEALAQTLQDLKRECL